MLYISRVPLILFSLCFAGQLAPVSAGANEVRDELFADPTNIQLNLTYLQQQLAGRNFKGAAATLQRVLLLDPQSRLAKVLYAEVQIQLNNFPDARSTLQALLRDKAIPETMRTKANDLLATIEQAESRLRFSGSISLSGGSADNALATPKGPLVQFYNALFENTSPEVTEAFTDYSLGISMNYALPTYRERNAMISFGVTGRDYADMDSADSSTGYIAINFSEKRKTPWGLSYSAAMTEVNAEAYNVTQQVSLSANRKFSKGKQVSLALRGGTTRHFAYLGSSASKSRDGTLASASLSYAQPIRLASRNWLLSVKGGAGKNNAEEEYYSNDSTSVLASLGTRIAAINYSAALDFVSTKFDAADSIIGDDIREDERTLISLSASYQLPKFLGGAIMSLSGFAADTRSNIPNFTKTVSELKFGVSRSF